MSPEKNYDSEIATVNGKIDAVEIQVKNLSKTVDDKFSDVNSKIVSLKSDFQKNTDEIKANVNTLEHDLRLEIKENRREIKDLVENELIHLRLQLEQHLKNSNPNSKINKGLDFFKIGGAVVGVTAGIWIFISNWTNILTWLYNVLRWMRLG